MRMWIYIVRRLILFIPVIVGVMTITFSLVSALPVDDQLIAHFGAPGSHDSWIYSSTIPPGQGSCPANATAPCANPYLPGFLHVLGLDQPIPVQWATYLYHSFTFD